MPALRHVAVRLSSSVVCGQAVCSETSPSDKQFKIPKTRSLKDSRTNEKRYPKETEKQSQHVDCVPQGPEIFVIVLRIEGFGDEGFDERRPSMHLGMIVVDVKSYNRSSHEKGDVVCHSGY